MNEQMNILLEVLEEIKQQNKELKTSISNLPQPTESQGEVENRKNLAGIAKILEEQLEFHRQFREELCQVIVKLGERIHEMKSGITEVRISQDEATDKLLTELQPKQTTPEMKLSKYYLFDVKRWAEWLIWGVMVAVLACIIGWAAHLYGVNQTLDSHALRYRILRMELGYTQPNIARLDSLFSSEDSSDSIRKLRSRVTNYELAIERQAELQLQQQHLSQEQEALSQQLKH
ncbi:hypothetical protein [Porphyromonas somerae]|jgi:hypothetical protein|uniref:Uncharacterized protein n=1 Tax=Porphyromonas somerae TaxID=322095 RepID=A0A134B328_9PORP|nr:hypothetical protein [Porphyromonas somerae]KXB72314.1 hypothetical protein HMPREF3184_01745 [Porphyromonadaceae bacterium KA00676]KXB74344.1 hypothetical protein HMPREF3185_01745 [Porphyromonas somerae]